MAFSRRKLIATIVVGLAGLAGGQTPAVETKATTPVQWVLPANAMCLIDDCPRYTQAGIGSEGIIHQGSMFAVELPLPGELTLPEQGEYPVIRRVGDLEERLIFTGPAAIYLEPEGGYVFISPGSGHVGDEDERHSVLKHGYPPAIAGVEGTRFDFVISPYGVVLIRVSEGLVRVRWPGNMILENAQIRAGEAILLDPHQFSGPLVQRFCPVEGERDCGEMEVRRFYSDDVDRWWQKLNQELNERSSREGECHLLSKLFRKELEPINPLLRPADAQRKELLGKYTDLLVDCGVKEISSAAQMMNSRLVQDSIAEHALYLAWVKAALHGDLAEARVLAELLARAPEDSIWRMLLFMPDLVKFNPREWPSELNYDVREARPEEQNSAIDEADIPSPASK